VTDRVAIDVDAHRLARREKQGPPPVVKIDGREFDLPQDLPAEAIYALGAAATDPAQLAIAMKALFGENFAVIFALCPAWDDQEFILLSAVQAYGFTLPESAASARS
jgi:hypothetical protein